MKNLSKIIEIVLALWEAFKRWQLWKRKEDLKNAAEESIEKKDQRPLESEIGTSTDNPTEYDGMYKRPRKKE